MKLVNLIDYEIVLKGSCCTPPSPLISHLETRRPGDQETSLVADCQHQIRLSEVSMDWEVDIDIKIFVRILFICWVE